MGGLGKCIGVGNASRRVIAWVLLCGGSLGLQAAPDFVVLEALSGKRLADTSGQACTELIIGGDFGSVATLGAGPIQPDPVANPGVIFGPPLDPSETSYTFAASGTFGCVGEVGCWPFDGEYLILNHNRGMLNPPEAEDGWEYVEDNSADPDGYYLLVNADESPGLFFKREVTLVPDESYRLSVDIINICSGDTCEIMPDIEFVVAPAGTGDEELATMPATGGTGTITTFEWETYSGAFVPEDDETAVVVAFRSIVPGGMGNDFGVDNVSLLACSDGPEPQPPAVAVPFIEPRGRVLMIVLMLLIGGAAIATRRTTG